MRYLILAAAALFAAQGALAQSTAPADAGKPVVKQPSGAAAAKNVGTHDMTGKADAYLKGQEKKRARSKHRGDSDARVAKADDADVRPGSLMTEEERAEHRKKLHGFKTYDECQKYQQDYQAKVEARAKEQHKALRPFNDSACNRYKAAASKPGPAKPAAK